MGSEQAAEETSRNGKSKGRTRRAEVNFEVLVFGLSFRSPSNRGVDYEHTSSPGSLALLSRRALTSPVHVDDERDFPLLVPMLELLSVHLNDGGVSEEKVMSDDEMLDGRVSLGADFPV
jgi:hypothetical protein